MKLNRRHFLFGSFVGALGGTAILSGLKDTTEQLYVEKTSLRLEGLPESFNNYKIGFISDLHYGISLSLGMLERVAEQLTKAELDLLVLGGDYPWIPHDPETKLFAIVRNPELTKLSNRDLYHSILGTIADLFGKVPAKDGRIAVLGNHDRWEGAELCRQYFEQSGINLLVNEEQVVRRRADSLHLTGVDDYWTGVPELVGEPLLESGKSLRILVAHNPDFVAESILQARMDFALALCGHTHGGQIRFPLIGAPVTRTRYPELLSGLNLLRKTPVYTTRGIGTVEIAMRFNCPPEISILTLKTA